MGKHIRYYSKPTNLDQLWCWSQPLDLLIFDIICRTHLKPLHPFVENPPDRWFIKINDEKTSDVPCLHGDSGGFVHSEERCCGDQWHLCCPKSYEFGHRKWRIEGVPNLLRHELTILTSWPMFFRFSGFLLLWWPSKSLRNWLFGSLWLRIYAPAKTSMWPSKLDTLQLRFLPLWHFSMWPNNQYAAAKNVGWHRGQSSCHPDVQYKGALLKNMKPTRESSPCFHVSCLMPLKWSVASCQ